jgi:ATP/maltotriose-dependent transcriptional regulator MalT
VQYELAKYYYNEYEGEKGLKYVDAALSGFQKLEEARKISVAYNLKGNLLSDIGKYTEAKKAYEKAIAGAKKLKNDTLTASFSNNLGLVLKNLGAYKEAIDVYYESLKLKEKIGATEKSISATLLNLGVIWDLMEDSKKAEEYYQQSLELKMKLNDSLGVSKLLSNIAVIYKNRGKLDKAEKLILQSEAYNAQIGNLEQYYVNHTNLGNIYKLRGNFELAIAFLEKAYEDASELNNLTYLSDVCQNLGSLHFDRKNYPAAIRYLDQAMGLPGNELTPVLKYELYGNLSEAFAAVGNYQRSHASLVESNFWRDSIFKIENQKAIQEVREQYETAKKEKEIVAKDLRLAQAAIRDQQKNWWITFLVAALSLALLLFWMLYRWNRKRHLKIRIVQEQRLEAYRTEIDRLQTGIQMQLADVDLKPSIQLSAEELKQYLIDPLSEREQEVLDQMALGKTNKEIAEVIFVSENTVKFHLKNIYLKLDVKNRTEAINKANALQLWSRA